MNYCKLLSEVYVLQIYGNAITIIEIYWRGKIIDFVEEKKYQRKIQGLSICTAITMESP